MSFIDLNKIEGKEVVPGFTGKFIHSEYMSIAFWTIKAGHSLPEHKHVHEQIANVIAGEIELVMEGKSHILTKDTCLIIPSNVPHSGKAITDCYIVDVFYPVREDLRD